MSVDGNESSARGDIQGDEEGREKKKKKKHGNEWMEKRARNPSDDEMSLLMEKVQ